MAASLNKVQLIGRLGADPEVKYTPAGTPVASFSLATSERWKDRDGNQQEKTEWHRCVCWNRLGEIAGEYLKKGALIYLEGRLQTRSWNDREGNKRYTTEVIGQFMQMLDRRQDQEALTEEPQGMPEELPGIPPDDDTIPF